MDPLAALARAEEALAETNFASDGNGHWSRLDPALKAQMQEGMEKARAAYESGGATGFSGGFPQGAPSAFSQPPLVEDPITKVERLARLRDSGALTEDEFDEQKRRALEEG